MSSLKYSIVDAFTTTAFKGNAAGVVVIDKSFPVPDTVLQLIAAEFNVPNTAFVTPVNSSAGLFELRWFTPKVEVAICGHATLATASILFSRPDLLPENVRTIEFKTRSGVLTANCLSHGRIELEFPASEVTAVEDTLREKVEDVVRQAFQATVPNLNVRFVGTGKGVPFGNFILVEIDGVDLEEITINANAFLDLPPHVMACMLTHRGRNESETFISRVFGPAMGVPEDPVTGSAHCMLGPYWAQKLQVQGETEMSAKQVSTRSGEVGVVWDRQNGSCKIRGRAVLVASGELYMPK